MKDDVRKDQGGEPADGPAYLAPALEKGLDIIELLSRSELPLTQKEIAKTLGRSVGELYRMITCLAERGYIAVSNDRYHITTRLFELAHRNPPMHRLLTEAFPLMQQLSDDLDQSCHLTVYNRGRQIVISKVDAPSGIGFSVRIGAEMDVLVSASGRALLAFQDAETRERRIEECLRRRPDHADPQIRATLDMIRMRGFESIPSAQVRGLFAVSYPIRDPQGQAIAALTVPYAERLDIATRKPISEVEVLLGETAKTLSQRIGGVR